MDSFFTSQPTLWMKDADSPWNFWPKIGKCRPPGTLDVARCHWGSGWGHVFHVEPCQDLRWWGDANDANQSLGTWSTDQHPKPGISTGPGMISEVSKMISRCLCNSCCSYTNFIGIYRDHSKIKNHPAASRPKRQPEMHCHHHRDHPNARHMFVHSLPR